MTVIRVSVIEKHVTPHGSYVKTYRCSCGEIRTDYKNMLNHLVRDHGIPIMEARKYLRKKNGYLIDETKEVTR